MCIRDRSIALQNTQNANTEIFSNGNFENGKTSWRGNFNLTNQIVKEGNSALILTSESKDWTGIDQQVSIPENMKSVTISGWLKAENIKKGDNAVSYTHLDVYKRQLFYSKIKPKMN